MNILNECIFYPANKPDVSSGVITVIATALATEFLQVILVPTVVAHPFFRPVYAVFLIRFAVLATTFRLTN